MSDLTGPELRVEARRRTAAGDLEGAAALMNRAIETFAAALADSHGALGGIHKRAGDLARAIDAYDAGYDIESRYALTSSYNAMNRLLVRVLVAPDRLTEPDSPQSAPGADDVQIGPALAAVREQLDRATAEDAGDEWTLGDLAVVSAMQGDDVAMARALDRLDATSPTKSERETFYGTAAALAALDTPRRELFTELASRLA